MPDAGLLSRRVLLGAGTALVAGHARGQDGPSLTVIVSHGAGTSPDRLVRTYLPFLSRLMPGTRMIVTNRPDDAGEAAARDIATARPDGGTIGFVSLPLFAARWVDGAGGLGLGSFQWLGGIGADPLVLLTRPGAAGHRKRPDELARKWRQGHDEAVVAVPGERSAARLALLSLEIALGTTIPVVHFPGAGAARRATAAGHVPYALIPLSEAGVAIREEKLIPLGIAATARSPLLPDLATCRERGLPLVSELLRGFVAPAGVGREAGARLATAITNAASDPDFSADAASQFVEARAISASAFAARAAEDQASLVRVWNDRSWALPAVRRPQDSAAQRIVP